MGVTVDDSINIVGIGRHGAAGPVGNRSVGSKMPYQEYIVRSFFAGIIDCTLNCAINFFTGLVFTETVNEFSVFILKILGSRGHQGFRSGDAYESNLFPTQGENLIGFQDGFPGFYVNKVAGIIPAFLPGR